MLPYLPTALHVLMHVSADCQDLCDVMALLSQLILRYKAALQDLLKEVLLLSLHACVSGNRALKAPAWALVRQDLLQEVLLLSSQACVSVGVRVLEAPA